MCLSIIVKDVFSFRVKPVALHPLLLAAKSFSLRYACPAARTRIAASFTLKGENNPNVHHRQMDKQNMACPVLSHV